MAGPYGINVTDEYDASTNPFKSGMSLQKQKTRGLKLPYQSKNQGVRIFDKIGGKNVGGFRASESGSGDPRFSIKG